MTEDRIESDISEMMRKGLRKYKTPAQYQSEYERMTPAEIADKYIGSFDPDDRDDVKRIKGCAKMLVEIISELETKDIRRKSIAITHVEEAAMMAIKSLYGGA